MHPRSLPLFPMRRQTKVYTKLKHAETWYKGIGRVKNELSCVDPALYCERFVGFMEETTS